MSRKFVKDVDSGEIYLLPDEKQATQNIPTFICNEDNCAEDIEDCYRRNCSIVDLQKQLSAKDKQLKKATRNKLCIEHSSIVACCIIFAVVVLLSVVIITQTFRNVTGSSLVSGQVTAVSAQNEEKTAQDESDSELPQASKSEIPPNDDWRHCVYILACATSPLYVGFIADISLKKLCQMLKK